MDAGRISKGGSASCEIPWFVIAAIFQKKFVDEYGRMLRITRSLKRKEQR